MLCAANFEVVSDISVISDDSTLKFNDPKGSFKAYIRNIPRSEFTVPFLLSVHLYFQAKDLEDAKNVSDDILAQYLNMLALTTGSRFRKHRIRQIVDAETSSSGAIRDILMWGERIEYADPQPFLEQKNINSIEKLMEFDIPPAIRRALRWYRLGIDADSPDDQFTYFWFSLEIVAEFQKSSLKVNDRCPRCRSALYCEKCESYPEHKPYAKQAIRALMIAAGEGCDDATADMLDKTRNSLMHGATLREIEKSLPSPHESVVDTLGKILLNALLNQFPKSIFDNQFLIGAPSTYIHYKTNAVAHIQTVIPIDKEGNFDLDFKGIHMTMKPFGPPQSALPSVMRMTYEQYALLQKLSYSKSADQEMLDRIQQRVQEQDGYIHALVLATDLSAIRQALKRKEEGEWQDLFREILKTDDSGEVY